MTIDLFHFSHTSQPSIPGLVYISNYFTHEQETDVISCVDQGAWRNDLKRRVQHFGYRYDYKARKVTKDAYLGPLPDWTESMCTRLVEDGLFPTKPDQVIINEYLPGQGISAHVDCISCFGGTIASLSLGSGAVMRFTKIRAYVCHDVYLEPGSLILLSGPARYEWKHEITARKSDSVNGRKVGRGRRLSLTLRNVMPST